MGRVGRILRRRRRLGNKQYRLIDMRPNRSGFNHALLELQPGFPVGTSVPIRVASLDLEKVCVSLSRYWSKVPNILPDIITHVTTPVLLL
jgi:hypothetical protein